MDFVDYINKTSSKAIVNNSNKLNNKSLKKCSHLYFQDKHLTKIPKFSAVKDVLVLYLYNNEITAIDNLDGFSNLTSLYLQNNEIERMENLTNLSSLKRLFIGHNRISVLEGLENMECLQELHIEKQNLSDNISLCVDPRTVYCISETLQILNVSHNNITSLLHLLPLKRLKVINASFNDLDDIKEICKIISNWYYLKEAAFTGNPFTKRHRYREEIIANSQCLENLDEKSISDVTRSFIRRFEEEKLMHGTRQSVTDVCPSLSRNYPPALKNAVSASLLKKAHSNVLGNFSTFDEANDAYIAWKMLPKRKPRLKTPLRLLNRRINNNKKNVTTSFPHISP